MIEGAERLPDLQDEIRSETTPEGVMPPARSDRLPITQAQALTLIPVYRAFSLISSAVSQLSLDLWRGEETIPSPTWVRRPDVKVPRSAWLEMTTTSLAANGNAFWRVERSSPAEAPSALLVLDPNEVHINDDGTFSHRGRTLASWQVQHLALLRVPGRLRGLGPIQAAAQDLTGAADLRDYASEWFNAGTVPNGVLKSDQHITAEQAAAVKTQWLTSVNGAEPAVLGNGLDYRPLLISPKDAQFLESRQFTVTDIARLFGIPSHLMLSVVEGGSMTYLNGQAADLSFLRWTLMAYLREIEEAVTALLPRGQTARFNVDAILRPSTQERYDAHKVALEAGFLTVDEVRRIEGLDPLGPAPAPTEEPS
ncbi:phage portal protein [Ornithinimicrobium sp. W1665]|uniref:phage portal protein n=1 Tax=Ornithinimicrobium sp. W1665 TaxID=3416666 RepID=UPI003CEBB1EE